MVVGVSIGAYVPPGSSTCDPRLFKAHAVMAAGLEFISGDGENPEQHRQE